MSFPRYESYRDSGVEWLGDVPEHWCLRKLKTIASFAGGGTPNRDNLAFWNGDIPWVSPKDMKAEGIYDTEEHITIEALESSAANIRRAGEVLLVVRSGILRHTIPVAINFVSVALNQDMKALAFQSDKCLPDFFLRWVQGLNKELLLVWGKQGATVESIEHTFLAETQIPLPPLEEQSAIAAFLDRETAKIDALVEEQRRLIELLKEKRQALISHTVTKGLDSETPMKDSGVEWLGEVPAHWLIGPVGARYDVQLGQMLNEERTRGDFLKPYLRVFDVQWDSINTEDLPQMNFPPSAQVRYQLKPGDLLVNEGGSYVGRSAIWRGEIEECYYQKALHRLRARDPSTETAEFFLFVMEMATQVGVFVAEGNQTTIDHLTAEQLRATRVAFPPPLEQKAIAEYLQRETANLLALIEEIASAIALLQERRSALISATVTGKIDVRGQVAEAKAPEEAAAA